MDRHVWGYGTWELLLLAAHTADIYSASRSTAHRFFLFATQSIPCEPCREYFTHNVVVWLSNREERDTSFTSWLYDMRSIIDSKVKGSLGCGDVAAGTAAAVVPVSNRYQLLKRAHVGGVIISSDQVCIQFMLQALCLRDVGKKPSPDKTTEAFRAYSLAMAIKALADLVAPLRPAFHRVLKKALRTAVKGAQEEGDGWTWALPFTAAYLASAALEDGSASLPGMTPPAMIEHLLGARGTLVEWSVKHCLSRPVM